MVGMTTNFRRRKEATEFLLTREGPLSNFTLRVLALMLESDDGKWTAKAERLPSSPASYIRAAKRLCDGGFATQVRDGKKLTDVYQFRQKEPPASIERYYTEGFLFVSIGSLEKRYAAKARGRKSLPPIEYLRASVEGEVLVFTPIKPSETTPIRTTFVDAFRHVARATREEAAC